MGNIHADVLSMWFTNVSHGIRYAVQNTSCFQNVNRMLYIYIYRICSRNLSNFFSILAAEKSGCVKYADFFCGGLDLGFILV